MGERFWGVFFQNFLNKFFANKKAAYFPLNEVNRRLFTFRYYLDVFYFNFYFLR